LQTGAASGLPRTGSGSVAATPAISIAPDTLRRIEDDLTGYIGPIAPVILRRLLSKSASLADFFRDLAAHIPNEQDRAKFLISRQLPKA
jgi:hypothetical protein